MRSPESKKLFSSLAQRGIQSLDSPVGKKLNDNITHAGANQNQALTKVTDKLNLFSYNPSIPSSTKNRGFISVNTSGIFSSDFEHNKNSSDGTEELIDVFVKNNSTTNKLMLEVMSEMKKQSEFLTYFIMNSKYGNNPPVPNLQATRSITDLHDNSEANVMKSVVTNPSSSLQPNYSAFNKLFVERIPNMNNIEERDEESQTNSVMKNSACIDGNKTAIFC